MNLCIKKALVACGNVARRVDYAAQFLHSGWHVHTVADAAGLQDLLAKQRYGITLVDDSLTDMGCAEAVLTIQQMAPNGPVVVVAGEFGPRHAWLWAQTKVALNAGHKETAQLIPQLIDACEWRNGYGRA